MMIIKLKLRNWKNRDKKKRNEGSLKWDFRIFHIKNPNQNKKHNNFDDEIVNKSLPGAIC